MIFLFLLLSSTGTIDFHVDPVVYRTTVEVQDTIMETTKTDGIFYIEFNCATPHHELYYEAVDGVIIAKATIIFKLSDLNRSDSLVDTLYRQFTIPSFSEAALQQMSFVIQFGLHVPEGKFKYMIEMVSGPKTGVKDGEIGITKEQYKISDILLASNIMSDTTSGYLRKGNLQVLPHPSHLFNERYSRLYIYYEIYDVIPGSDSLEITYMILDEDGKIIRKVSRAIEKKFKSQAVNFGLDIQALNAGNYIFSVEVRDTNMQTIAQREIPFTVEKIGRREVSYEGMPYYEEIEYFLRAEEYRNFQELPKEGKRMFLKKFWELRNYYEIATRFEYADTYYQEGMLIGHKTDRGRIHVKFGPPDEIERTTIQYYEVRPYEHWQYYNGLDFLFVDIRGTNEYTLVWTDVIGEQSRPTLYKYIPFTKSYLIK